MNLKEVGVTDVFAQDEMTDGIDEMGMISVSARWGEDPFWSTECLTMGRNQEIVSKNAQ